MKVNQCPKGMLLNKGELTDGPVHDGDGRAAEEPCRHDEPEIVCEEHERVEGEQRQVEVKQHLPPAKVIGQPPANQERGDDAAQHVHRGCRNEEAWLQSQKVKSRSIFPLDRQK